ncbi:MAG: hypothetical protein ACRD0P_35040 [Stackebrandtia sp.]
MRTVVPPAQKTAPGDPPAAESTPVDELAGVVTMLRNAEAKVAEWNAARDELRRVLADRLGDAGVGTVDGHSVVKYTSYVDRRISTKLVRELAPPELLDQCHTETVRRRFTLVNVDAGDQS